MLWSAFVVLACAGAGAGADGGEGGGEVQSALLAGGVFRVQSTVLVNAAERRDRDVGYRLEAELHVAPAHPAGDAAGGEEGDEDLLRFTLVSPVLLLRGAHRSAEWEARGPAWGEGAGEGAGEAGAWYAALRRGVVRRLLLPRGEAAAARDYKAALAALYQYRGPAAGAGAGAGGAPRNETDVSGACAVLYEHAPPDHFRKIKTQCEAERAVGGRARRVSRYTVRAGALLALHAEEVLELPGALKARSWHALQRAAPAPPRAPPPPPALQAAPLALAPAADDDDDEGEDERQEVGAAIRRHAAALQGDEPGEGGTVEAARALLHLLPALRAARADALRAALRDLGNRPLLGGLCRALGLAGTRAAAAAARDFTHAAAAEPLEALALEFLAGFALAPLAHEDAVLDVVRLSAEARRPAVAEGALLAAAGAARGGRARAAVRDAAVRALPRCGDAACRALRLRALANLRADEPELLLRHAEADAPRAAAAALAALRAAPTLRAPHAARLARLAANGSQPLEVRAAALALAAGAGARRAAALARALHAERGGAAHELRRVLWQRLEAAGGAAAARALLPAALRGWDARAHAGTSGALRRDPGWAARGWAARLDSVQLAARGVLRRGTVALLALAPDGTLAPELEVSVWTRGLEALAGAAGEGDAAGEEAAGGLALAVGGVHMPEVQLFDGQAELLGHVWSGAGAAPRRVVRALRPLAGAGARGAVPLAGGCTARVGARAALALALDAHAAVSLWHRTARGALALRAALAGRATLRVRTAWGTLRAERSLAAEPRLRIAFDLDFYEGAALCVRPSTPAHAVREELRLESVLGPRRRRVSRGESRRAAAAARSLALDARNDAACRALQPAHDDD